jgi:hypothetical protein
VTVPVPDDQLVGSLHEHIATLKAELAIERERADRATAELKGQLVTERERADRGAAELAGERAGRQADQEQLAAARAAADKATAELVDLGSWASAAAGGDRGDANFCRTRAAASLGNSRVALDAKDSLMARRLPAPDRLAGPSSRRPSILLLMLLPGALCGCAYAPAPASQLDARTLCEEQAQASASAPEASDTQKYFDQCMIAESKEKSKAEQ